LPGCPNRSGGLKGRWIFAITESECGLATTSNRRPAQS
jgi:hypothetical protein